jgi:hypothetical protein
MRVESRSRLSCCRCRAGGSSTHASPKHPSAVHVHSFMQQQPVRLTCQPPVLHAADFQQLLGAFLASTFVAWSSEVRRTHCKGAQ